MTELSTDQRDRLVQNEAGLFTSDLSVREFLLVEQAGYDALGLVLGSSVYPIGIQKNLLGKAGSCSFSRRSCRARELAMTRMEAEASQLGAEGVIGVHLTAGARDWGADTAEFVAIGTAVRRPDTPQRGKPFTCDLSGQDLWLLSHS